LNPQKVSEGIFPRVETHHRSEFNDRGCDPRPVEKRYVAQVLRFEVIDLVAKSMIVDKAEIFWVDEPNQISTND
jgi:hypothetical protein